MIQNHALWAQRIDLPRHELSEGTLNGLAINGAPTSGSQDSNIWTRVVQDTAPMSARILIQQRAFWRLEQVHKAAASAAASGIVPSSAWL